MCMCIRAVEPQLIHPNAKMNNSKTKRRPLTLDAPKQVSRPQDVASHRRRIARHGWVVLVLLVNVLHLAEIKTIVMEDE